MEPHRTAPQPITCGHVAPSLRLTVPPAAVYNLTSQADRVTTMIVADVMTRNVHLRRAGRDGGGSRQADAGTRGISGLFVVDTNGDLAGIVTEGDLLRRDETRH